MKNRFLDINFVEGVMFGTTDPEQKEIFEALLYSLKGSYFHRICTYFMENPDLITGPEGIESKGADLVRYVAWKAKEKGKTVTVTNRELDVVLRMGTPETIIDIRKDCVAKEYFTFRNGGRNGGQFTPILDI